MTRDNKGAAPSDAELVAYLDGELSPADSVHIGQQLTTDERLAARVGHLMKGGRPFRDAFAPLLLEAPLETLEAGLQAALARTSPAAGRSRSFWPAAAAAAVGLLVLGSSLDRFVLVPHDAASSDSSDESEAWRGAVAQYLSMYTSETLATAEIADVSRLATLGDRLGLALTPERVALSDLPLKRADLYDYDGKPLVFLAYLDPQTGPLAFCITDQRSGSDAQRVERRNGMTVVYWSQGRHGFMLIGHAPAAQLQALATTVGNRFATRAGERG